MKCIYCSKEYDEKLFPDHELECQGVDMDDSSDEDMEHDAWVAQEAENDTFEHYSDDHTSSNEY